MDHQSLSTSSGTKMMTPEKSQYSLRKTRNNPNTAAISHGWKQFEVTSSIENYLLKNWAARKIRTQAARHVTVDREIYKWRFSGPLMTCLEGEKARKVMEDVHSGSCRNNSGGRSLTVKIKRHRYYWPTVIGNCEKFARKCENAKGIPRPSINPQKSSLPSHPHIFLCAGPWISLVPFTTKSKSIPFWSSPISSQNG